MNIIYTYGRYSSELQSKGQTVERQEEQTRLAAEEYVKRTNSTALKCDRIYFDRATSAYKEEDNNHSLGSEWHSLMNVIRKGDIVCIESLSRFSRLKAVTAIALLDNYLQRHDFILFIRYSGQILDKESFDSGFSDLQTFIDCKQNNNYVRELARRLKDTINLKKTKAMNGESVFKHRAPDFLKWNENTKSYIEKHSAIKYTIHFIFSLAKKGHSASSIISVLNNDLLKYPPFAKNAKVWSSHYIRKLLKNYAVIGINKVISSTDTKQYPIMIEEELFYAVNTNLSTFSSKYSKHPAIFSGLLKCSHCGSSYHSVVREKKVRGVSLYSEYDNEEYKCSGRSENICKSNVMPTEALLFATSVLLSMPQIITESIKRKIMQSDMASTENNNLVLERQKAQLEYEVILEAFNENKSSKILLKKLVESESALTTISDREKNSKCSTNITNNFKVAFNACNSKEEVSMLIHSLIKEIRINDFNSLFSFEFEDNTRAEVSYIINEENIILSFEGNHYRHDRGVLIGKKKKRIFELGHILYPYNIFEWRNIKTGEIFVGTRAELNKKNKNVIKNLCDYLESRFELKHAANWIMIKRIGLANDKKNSKI